MIENNTYVVIMAGGVGSRFWPLSRKKFPKQFHDFLGIGKSLIQMTYERHLPICKKENIIVVTNKEYYSLVKENLPDLSDNQILLEPFGKNTAPCIAYATHKVKKTDPDANFIVCPADHLILNEAEYLKNINIALDASRDKDILVTLGIKPNRPDTGYGYIQFVNDNEGELKKVKTFTEKPNQEFAEKFIESGDYVWNAGIFIWSSKSIVKAFGEQLFEQNEIFKEGTAYYNTPQEQDYINDAYGRCKSISIDYGIMEKASNVYTVLSDFGWSDLGTWGSVYEKREKDENKNVLDGDILAYDTKNSIIKGGKDKLLVVQGLDDFIVVDHENVLMICPKTEEQKVKTFVTQVTKEKGENFV